MKELLLYIVAKLGKRIFGLYLFPHGVISAIKRKELKKYLFTLALSEDQYGNVMGQYHFNKYWIAPGGYKFGNPDETISSAIGRNKKANTLRKQGRFIDSVLEKLDKNHSINAIEKCQL